MTIYPNIRITPISHFNQSNANIMIDQNCAYNIEEIVLNIYNKLSIKHVLCNRILLLNWTIKTNIENINSINAKLY